MMLFTACSSKDDGKIELRYSIWDNTHKEAIETLIDGFEAENPNIDIQLEVISNGDYWTKMETAATGGSAPDVFWVDGRRFGNYADNDLVLSLEDYIKEHNIDMSQYIESVSRIYNFEGEQYAIPSFWGSTVLLINTNLMEEYGIERPNKDWNWEEMIAWLEDAKSKLPEDVDPFTSSAAQFTQIGIFNEIAMAGGKVLNEDKTKALIDTPETIEAYKKLTDLLKSDLHTSFEETIELGPTAIFKSEKALAYQCGIYLFLELSDAEQAQIAGNFEVYPLPVIKEGTNSRTVIHGLGNVISANSKHPDEAFEFIKYMSTEEAMTTYTELALVPQSHKNVRPAYLDIMKEKTGLDVSSAYDITEDAMPFPNSVQTEKWDKVITDNISAYVQDKITFDEMIQNTQKGVQEILDKENQ
ncbi:MAG: ABC transporter substrate-binding protein [Romboutsia sp.]|uniref:ABC transporter substrate-binding protein n=1 Tax=Romboutsia sp. TaxID=1965302 RepID=UPI003F2CF783